MSARTCLLCGKPLSRIWVGAGDDFCSREHGNQYRLKRGMDRLTETNKISSLMRRRENPRPIASAQPAARFRLLAPRFPGSENSSRRRNAFPVLAPAFRVFDAADLAGLRALRASRVLPRLAGSSEPRQPDSSLLRFSARKTAPVAPVRRAALPVRIPRARAALLRDRILGTGSEHRGFGALRHAGIRAHAGFGGIAPSRIEPPGAACFLNAQRPRGIKAPPRTGSLQGLSRGFGFRRPARRRAVCAWPLKARVAVASLAVARAADSGTSERRGTAPPRPEP